MIRLRTSKHALMPVIRADKMHHGRCTCGARFDNLPTSGALFLAWMGHHTIATRPAA